MCNDVAGGLVNHMNYAETMRSDAYTIINGAISAVLPDNAVTQALKSVEFPGRIFLVAVGKAAWQMGKAAVQVLQKPLSGGIIITKYGHVQGELQGIRCFEAGHPIPDENTLKATEAVLGMTENLRPTDTVIFLLSGGGSALFEKPCIPMEELQEITSQLLAVGADIVEINVLRKHLSLVKGGRFAEHCAPARVFSVVLSDVIGDSLDMIASGPTVSDSSTGKQALAVAEKYKIPLSIAAKQCIERDTPKTLSNVETQITGSVRELCSAAAKECRKLGYEPIVLTDCLRCEARDAGSFLASIACTYADRKENIAFIVGGETVVHLTGKGKGGRNQELALSAAEGIAGMENVLIFSVGSDGTDGPTDAAGGIVDGNSAQRLKVQGKNIAEILQDNDAYHALRDINGLVMTGPTGTNVNDFSAVLIRR